MAEPLTFRPDHPLPANISQFLNPMRADVAAHAPAPPIGAADRRADLIAIAAITVCVSLVYGARLALQPLVGEETRWATAAREMLDTGDWIVPRQQSQVFAERPPMTIWLMALGGWLRGDVDPIAIRLPSVVAMVLTSLLIYGYTRAFTTSATALIAALVYATSGQVLEIGRLGESESVFVLFVAGSLLLWHLGYVLSWRPVITWSLGFTFAALAALVKGPQAPIYFGAITVAYLAVMRDWRYLFRWQTGASGLLFAVIIAAWQIPFYLATDWASVVATWAGLAGDRIHLRGVLSHSITYPAETFACLLPWSPMLVALFWRDVRTRLFQKRVVTTFLVTALLVAYPTVWLASAARGRYFMPLYPAVAVLVGLLIECCASAPQDTSARRAWNRFILLWSAVIGAGALFVVGISLLPRGWAATLYQPRWFTILFATFAVVAVYGMWTSNRSRNDASPVRVVFAVACVMGLGVAGLLMNVNAVRWNDPTGAVAELAGQLPPGARLVSFTAIEHRFAYYYRRPIAEIPWPQTLVDLPADVDYFCFVRHWNDTAQLHIAGRGRSSYLTPGTLPFEWEEVMAICPDRQTETPTARSIVLGRVVRPLRAAVSDVSKPQRKTARYPIGVQYK